MDIVNIITNVGFPIAAALGVGWYVKVQTDNFREDVKALLEKYDTLIKETNDYMGENTKALEHLSDMLEGEENESRD